MSWFEKLKSLADIDLDINIANKTNKVVINTKGEETLEFSEEEGKLNLNIEKLKEKVGPKAFELIKSIYKAKGEIGRREAVEDAKIAEEQKDNEKIKDTLKFFRPKISERHFKALEASLYMREAWEERKEPIEKRKRDIINKFGDEGRIISNMCSAGYFDEGRYLRELYENLKESSNYKEGDYRELFEEIVENAPFSVFVSHLMGRREVLKKVKGKLRKYKKYGVKFVDVRGIGRNNVEKVKEVIETLDEELDEFEYEPLEKRESRIAIRIDPDSVEGLEFRKN